MYADDFELTYSVNPNEIPSIVKNDWGFVLRENEKELIIKLVQHLHQNEQDDKYTLAGANARLSFSLNTRKIVPILFISVMKRIIVDLVLDGNVISLGELALDLSGIIELSLFDHEERCVFLSIADITKNNPYTEFTKEQLRPCSLKDKYQLEDHMCNNHVLFPCRCYIEGVCRIQEDRFNAAFQKLSDRKAIVTNDCNTYRIAGLSR